MASGADLESANPLVTVHPLAKQVQRFALFVTLLRYDSLLQPQPYYARRWQFSDGGRTLSMALAPGLKWHDGTSTTARDAAFTFLAAKDPATGFPRAAELQDIDTVYAASDTELVFRYRRPQARPAPLLVELPIVPEHLLARVPRNRMRSAPFNDTPLGNGPFRFASRTRGARWSFTRNDAFPAILGGPPTLVGFTIAVVDEATTKFAGLASGELDIAGISPTMAALAQKDNTLRLVTYPVLFSNALCFNTTRAPFDDVRVRRAIALSLDRGRIVDVALAGYARPSASPVSPDNPLGWSPAIARDTLRADSLLDAAGWRRSPGGARMRAGRTFDVELLTVGSGDNVAEQLVQADLAARGITMRIRQVEMGSFLTSARAATKTYDMLIAGIPGDLSLSYIPGMFATAQRGGALDYTGFHIAALDDVLARAAVAPDGREGTEAWRAVQVAIDSLAPATWLYHSRGVQGMSRRVGGVQMDLRGELATLHDWRVATRAAP